jgi:type III protein arginine methyltransferase
MADWSNDLDQALAAGDPEFMKAMLARVPQEVMDMVVPYLEHMAVTCEADGRMEEAQGYRQQLAALGRTPEPDAQAAPARDAKEDALHIEVPAPPQAVFDPAIFANPAIAPDADAFRVDGLKQHLSRYSAQVSPRNAITRLDDPLWRDAWDAALSTMHGARVLFRGSELGILALRALHHGAAHALCVEAYPLDARIATGIMQKHFLAPWHARHGEAVAHWSEEERSASFNEFASGIDIDLATSETTGAAPCDCFVFPNIDHTLLGTGMVRALRQYCSSSGSVPSRVVPAKATVYAMGVQWAYPGTQLTLEPVDSLRWSLYPQTLDGEAQSWRALTETVVAGQIDFAAFTETTWEIALPVTAPGTVNAIIYWFDLDLGGARISSAPGGALRCIRPAVQYTDGIIVDAGGSVGVHARVEESRLYFETQPAPALRRSRVMPGWYASMLGDQRRNDAYRSAIRRAVAADPVHGVLDIGAGCGLLSMMAAQAGARSVVGCETDSAILRAGREIVALNALDGVISLVGKDCRKLSVPDDLPRRAGLALFEMFDCSLIGEGILHFLAYAREHLLTADAVFLPANARIRAMVVEYRLERVLDVDASLLNPYRASPAFVNVDAATLDYRPLSAPFDVFSFDFASAGPAPEEKRLEVLATAPGTAGAVLFWFDLGLDANCTISNSPAAGDGLHWKQGLQFLPEVRIEPGSPLPLNASHDGSGLQFKWRSEELPKESLSKMPRFDPRWLAASSDIEQQTGALMQHCVQHPEEYAKVADIATRFAIVPGAHGLDPTIAQRFAGMFFNR